MTRINLLGIPIDPLTEAQAVEWVAEALKGDRPRQITSVNPERIMLARSHPEFASVLRHADLSLADGMGVVWAARWKRTPMPSRVSGVDLVRALAATGAERGWRFFLLGAAPGVAEAAGAALSNQYAGFRLVGASAGSPQPADDAGANAIIRASGADILLVAFGAPAEELWIARNLARSGVKVAMGIGGAFDFIAGRAQRAPAWMRRYGLEWLHRLSRQPWRWRRMLALPRFVLAVVYRGDGYGPG